MQMAGLSPPHASVLDTCSRANCAGRGAKLSRVVSCRVVSNCVVVTIRVVPRSVLECHPIDIWLRVWRCSLPFAPSPGRPPTLAPDPKPQTLKSHLATRQSSTTTSGGCGMSGQSGQASFRSTYFRDGSPPRSHLLSAQPIQHSQRFVVATGHDPLYMTPSKRPKTVGRRPRSSRSNMWASSRPGSPRDGQFPDGRPASEPGIRSYDQIGMSLSPSRSVKPRILFGGPARPK